VNCWGGASGTHCGGVAKPYRITRQVRRENQPDLKLHPQRVLKQGKIVTCSHKRRAIGNSRKPVCPEVGRSFLQGVGRRGGNHGGRRKSKQRSVQKKTINEKPPNRNPKRLIPWGVWRRKRQSICPAREITKNTRDPTETAGSMFFPTGKTTGPSGGGKERIQPTATGGWGESLVGLEGGKKEGKGKRQCEKNFLWTRPLSSEVVLGQAGITTTNWTKKGARGGNEVLEKKAE